jgi:hypothetical protein
MKTLKDVLPKDFNEDHGAAYKHRDVEVIRQHFGAKIKWPGKQKNVNFWVELANGKAVGWNEHPSRGRSFPVINLNS